MKKVCILVFLFINFVLISCSPSEESRELGYKGKIKIGSKDFTEQILLSKITSIYLQEHGVDVEEVNNMGSFPLRAALLNDQIDLYWEYTGTALVAHQGHKPESDPEIVYNTVKKTDEKNGVIWLESSNINNQYVILVRKEKAEELGVNTISDLAKVINEKKNPFIFATQEEFYKREDGITGLEKHYGIEFPKENILKLDLGVLYHVLVDGQADASIGFATDGRIREFNLTVLKDDQSFFSPYFATPVVREEILSKEIEDLLNQLSAKLSTEMMISLNYLVDVEYMDISEVSRAWLQEQELID